MKKAVGFERRLRNDHGFGGKAEVEYPEEIGRPDQYDLWYDDQLRYVRERVEKIHDANKQLQSIGERLVFRPNVPIPLHFLRKVCYFMGVDVSDWVETSIGQTILMWLLQET